MPARKTAATKPKTTGPDAIHASGTSELLRAAAEAEQPIRDDTTTPPTHYRVTVTDDPGWPEQRP